MLDMEGIYQMVHNQTTIKRAIDYVREGRILFIDRQFGSEGAIRRGCAGITAYTRRGTRKRIRGRFGADAPAWRMRARTRRASTLSR